MSVRDDVNVHSWLWLAEANGLTTQSYFSLTVNISLEVYISFVTTNDDRALLPVTHSFLVNHYEQELKIPLKYAHKAHFLVNVHNTGT